MANAKIITQLNRLLTQLHYADDVNAVKAAIKKLEQEPCDKCEVGNPCLYCRRKFEPQVKNEESPVTPMKRNERANKMNFRDMTDDELTKYLRDYASTRSGEIADLTYAAGLRIAVLSTRVKALEEKGDDRLPSVNP